MIDAARVQQVLTWILEGQSDHVIRDGIREHWPEEQAEPLIVAAAKSLSDAGKLSHAEVQNWCFEATRYCYQKQIEIGEFSGAMRAIRQMQEISEARKPNAEKPQRIEHHHQHTIGIITSETLEFHRQRLAGRLIEISHDSGGAGSSRGIDQRKNKAGKSAQRQT